MKICERGREGDAVDIMESREKKSRRRQAGRGKQLSREGGRKVRSVGRVGGSELSFVLSTLKRPIAAVGRRESWLPCLHSCEKRKMGMREGSEGCEGRKELLRLNSTCMTWQNFLQE